MNTINVNLPLDAYKIYVGSDILEQFAATLRSRYNARQIAVITSGKIDKLYGDKLRAGFTDNEKILTLYVPEGEKAKTSEQAFELYTKLLENKFERSALIVALGGGIVGDLAGFVASTFLRGIPFVQVPTTLLAQVDSSIGGKVGINHPLGKNLIGAFKQPLFVYSDISVLKSLDYDELRCGLGEVVKYGFILNRSLFGYIESNLAKILQKDEKTLLHLVLESSRAKAMIVEQDEKEADKRMILNYGHTFGHALEVGFKFGGLKHGETVLLGMKAALAYEYNAGRMAESEYQRGINLLNRIPLEYDKTLIDGDRLVERMTLDKKVKDGKIRLILVNKIGTCCIDFAENRRALKEAFKILT